MSAQIEGYMSKRVYGLKHATPKMKYQHMKMVLEWRADLKEKQAEYVGEGNCPLCHNPIESRPLFMVGEYDMCYSCYRSLESYGIRPTKRAVDLGDSAAFLALSQPEVLSTSQAESTPDPNH